MEKPDEAVVADFAVTVFVAVVGGDEERNGY